MKLLDTFMFSEPYEADLLWVKLNVEQHLVEKWIVVENSYTFQGEHKGHHLNELLRADARFAAFLPRIHVIECEIAPGARTVEGTLFDRDALQLEWAQRNCAVPYLVDNYGDEAYVLISDVDECLDTESTARQRLLQRKTADGDEIILVPRIRYWFDFDNRGLGRRSVPLVSMARLRRDGALGRYREMWAPVVWTHEMVFEYSYCFPRDKIMRKFDTFSHTGFEPAEVEAALNYNHRPTSAQRARELGWNSEDWFLKRRLNSRNSPAFVRQHLDRLRTYAVSESYRQRRLEGFPEHFPAQAAHRYARWTALYGRLYVDLLNQNSRGRTAGLRRLKAKVARRIDGSTRPESGKV